VSALLDVRGKESRIAGEVSKVSQKGLEDLGWKMLEQQKGVST
jgi:hypothetical protein